jgi:hypothetical protein
MPEARAVRYVNTRKIKLNYKRKDGGTANLSNVELWCTRDSRTWKRYAAAVQEQPPYVIDVNEEGLYGFSLISAVGQETIRIPQPGDQPQIWVEVDLTKPVARLVNVEAGFDNAGRTTKIAWTASDKNLQSRPAKLSYAEHADGPWLPIAADLENTGTYTWRMPENLMGTYFVRIEAIDLAGNVGADQVAGPARPR